MYPRNAVKEVLENKKLLKGKELERVVFNEITKSAILNAKNFEDFDNAVTAPLFGFKNAKDY